jgi:hypothetical protein
MRCPGSYIISKTLIFFKTALSLKDACFFAVIIMQGRQDRNRLCGEDSRGEKDFSK